MSRTHKTSIGFNALLPKGKKDQETASETNHPAPDLEEPKTVLDGVEMVDLVNYGFIPEFVGAVLQSVRCEDRRRLILAVSLTGRVPVVAALRTLTEKDLLRILCEPRNSLVKQCVSLLDSICEGP